MMLCLTASNRGAMAAGEGTAARIGDPAADRIAYWENMIGDRPRGLGPVIGDRATWESIAKRPSYHALVAEAERLVSEPIPPLTDELILEYSKTGRRDACQERIFERCSRFSTLVVAECLENKGRFLSAIEAMVEDQCGQRTWLFPAHDPHLTNYSGKITELDLLSSAMGWNLATAAWWLGDKLSPGTRALVDENLERRIFAPFESQVREGKGRVRWVLNTANHNSVIMAGAVGAAMAHIESKKRRAYFAAAAEKFMPNYLSGFTPDGYCAEGIGYWNYGFGRYTMLAETLRQATAGKIDWLKEEHVRAIAEFGWRSQIQLGVYPTYSDCSPHEQPDEVVLGFLSHRYGWNLRGWEQKWNESSQVPSDDLFRLGIFDYQLAERNAVGEKPRRENAKLAIRDFFPEGGLFICRSGNENPRALAVCIKGGHNAEPHNHNDVGSFMLLSGSKVVLADPGAELYTSRTFSSRRYESDLLNSFGHSVPRVAGKLQSAGFEAKAILQRREEKKNQDTIVLDLARAYDVPELVRLERTFVFNRSGRGSLKVVDEVEFLAPQTFEVALITFEPWELESAGRIRFGAGADSVVAEVETEGLPFRVTSSIIEGESHAKEPPKRIAIVLDKPVSNGKISIVFREGASGEGASGEGARSEE
ncbi:MAG: heparinase II/III family protein [Pirellulales bacterium]|nr:heparinase II/III family protein [Pirellulales bacterium]